MDRPQHTNTAPLALMYYQMLLVEWGYFIKLHHIKDLVFFFMPSYSHFLCESPKTLSWGKDFPFIVYIMLQNARNKEGFSECVLHGRL